MIIVSADVDTTDAASTHTLVAEGVQKVPRHLPTLVYLSFVVSTLAFIFAIVDSVYNRWSNVPQGVVVIILAYVFTLPHHGAILLLNWLERHQTESILPFKPSSRRTLVFSAMCFGLWVGSVAVCAKNLYLNTRPYQVSSCHPVHPSSKDYTCIYFTFHPGVDIYGNSLASTITSTLETIIAISITVICTMQYRRLNRPIREAIPPPIATPSESKVLSA